jgi:hypothetical protein
LFKFYNSKFCFELLNCIFVIMKTIAQIILFIFVAFLLTPTVVCVLEKSDEMAVVSDFSEDEQAVKDIKVIFYSEIVFEIMPIKKSASSLIFSENLSRHDAVTSPLYATPPDLS